MKRDIGSNAVARALTLRWASTKLSIAAIAGEFRISVGSASTQIRVYRTTLGLPILPSSVTVAEIERCKRDCLAAIRRLSRPAPKRRAEPRVAHPILSVGAHDCRYLRGDPRAQDWCRQPVERGSYCAEHARLCYVPSSKAS